MWPSSKIGPAAAVAGPTGPVPPGLIILLLSVADEEIIPIRVSLSQAKCVYGWMPLSQFVKDIARQNI